MDNEFKQNISPAPSDDFKGDQFNETSFEVTENVNLDDPVAAKKLLRKLDLRILPILTVLWFLSFIDRVNIANAKVQKMEKSLHMKGNNYNVALTVFFATFILCEVPFNMILGARIPWFPPRVWLGLQCLILALFTIGEGLVETYGGLLAMRIMVGAFEAGLVPGSVLLLSTYYPRYHLQWRMGILAVGNALASAFGGLLAYAIIGMDGDLHRESWRWVFLIEGSVTAVVAIAGMFLIVDWPEKASFLGKSELKLVRHLIAKDCDKLARMDHLNADAIKRCLLDWKIWINVAIYAFTVCVTYSINLFGPTIIQGLNPTYATNPRKVLLLAAPVWLVCAVLCLASAWLSDRLHHRSGFVLTGYLVAIVGFGILLQPKGAVDSSIRYMAIYFVAGGSYISLPILWTMMANNVSGVYKVAFASSMQIGFGSVGGIIASSAYQVKDAPMYHQGHLLIFSLLLVALVLVVAFVVGIYFENRARAAGKRDHRLTSPYVNNMGDDHPQFKLTY